MISAHFESIYDHLTSALRQARFSVRICVAWMNPELYRHVLDGLIDRGVTIEIAYFNVMQNRKLKAYCDDRKITQYAVRPRFSRTFMHHKFCIIDDEILITGSYNWTKNAALGFENIIIADRELTLVKQFKHEYEDVREFVNGAAARQRRTCPDCGREAYHLAVTYPGASYAPIAMGVWLICERYRCTKLIHHAPHSDDDDFDVVEDEWVDSMCGHLRPVSFAEQQARMLEDFEQEREHIRSQRRAFAYRFKGAVDAFGTVRMKDEHLHLKGGGGSASWPEYEVDVQWRDVYYRKTIPEILTEDDGFRHVITGGVWM